MSYQTLNEWKVSKQIWDVFGVFWFFLQIGFPTEIQEMLNSCTCHTKLKIDESWKKSGLHLGYFDFFSKSVSKLEFKKSSIQVHIIPNLKRTESFKTNLGCIRVILIFLQIGFPTGIQEILNSCMCHTKLKIDECRKNLGCIWVILIFSPYWFPSWNLRNPQFRFISSLTLNNWKFWNKSGLYLGYFDFFSKSVSKLEFKKSSIQVHIIPNLKRTESFKTNMGCVRVILIFL